jgi:hypothetical protein
MKTSTAPRQTTQDPGNPWPKGKDIAGHAPDPKAAQQPAKPTPHFLAQLAHNQNAARAKATCAARVHEERTANPAPQPKRRCLDNDWMRKQLRDDEAFMPPPWCGEAYSQEEPSSRRLPAGLVATTLALVGGVGFGLVAWYMQDAETRAFVAAGTMPALVEKPQPQDAKAPASTAGVPAESSSKPVAGRIAAAPDTEGLRSASQFNPEADIVSETASIAPVANETKPTGRQAGTGEATQGKAGPAKATPSQAQLEIARHYRLRADENMLIGNVVSARALYFKAFQLGDAGAAYQLGRSYDPGVLEAMNVVGPKADVKLATDWYRQAKQAGYLHAGQQPRTVAQESALTPSAN